MLATQAHGAIELLQGLLQQLWGATWAGVKVDNAVALPTVSSAAIASRCLNADKPLTITPLYGAVFALVIRRSSSSLARVSGVRFSPKSSASNTGRISTSLGSLPSS
jgi:hypothetical protein